MLEVSYHFGKHGLTSFKNDNYSANFSGEKSTVTLSEVSIFENARKILKPNLVFVVEFVLETKGL